MKLFYIITIWSFFATNLLAQALDPNCWHPTIGDGIDIDEHDMSVDPYFGESLVRLQNPSDSSYYIACLGYRGNTTNHTVFHSDSPFNVHNLKLFKKLNIDLTEAIFGHFHDTKHLDALIKIQAIKGQIGPVIYWADDDGNYDTSRVAWLRSSIQGDLGPNIGAGFTFLPSAFIGHITSDTLDDVIYYGSTNWYSPHQFDSAKPYALLFRGGNRLYEGKPIVYEDSNIYWPNSVLLSGTTGDFTGDGKADWIASDSKGNMLFYRSSENFSMTDFINQMNYDTLLAAWQNPYLVDAENGNYLSNRLVIAGLPRKPGDKSVDFVPSLFTRSYPTNSLWFFRGGPNFGTHRITMDSAEIVITNPSAIDGNFSGFDFAYVGFNAGDLTGTGRPVLKIGGVFGHGMGYDLFYVLGDAIDEKIDAIISHPVATADVVQVDADGDKYGDIVFQAYSDYNGLTPTKSGLWVLHGSDKIPVHINPKYAAVPKNNITQSDCVTYPNPADASTTIRFTSSTVGNVVLSIRDVLGRVIEKKSFFTQSGLTSLQIPLDHIPNGTYYVHIENEKEQLATKVIISH